MGGLFSRTIVVDLTSQYSSELLQIETTVSELQARKQSQLSRKRQLGRALLLYGSVVWLLLAAVLYLIELPNRTHFVAKCVRIGPLIGWPVGLFLIAKLVDSYYTLQFRKTDATLAKLEKSKETKLEELMARTHFKETQKLISHFSEKKPARQQQGQQGQQQGANAATAGQQQQQQQQQQQHSTPNKMQQGGQGQMAAAAAAAGAAGRNASTPAAQGKHSSQTMPASAFKNAQQQQQYMLQQQQAAMQHAAMQSQSQSAMRGGSALVAPAALNTAIPTARSALDKVLDFILNDGPNSQFALICPHCFGHNGLVQEAELGKIRYRCAMCGALNGPPVPSQQQQQQQQALALQQQLHLQSGAQLAMSPMGPVAPTTPASGASSSGGSHSHSSAASIPLTPFAPLPPTSEEEEAEMPARRMSEAAAIAMAQRHDAESEEEAEGLGAPSSSRPSRRGSRVGAAVEAHNNDAAELEGDDDGAAEAPIESSEAAPRRRKSQRAK